MILLFQNNSSSSFVNSFKLEKSLKPVNFAELSELGEQMTKKEAILFVYNGDTSKLYCKQKIVNTETEEIEGVKTDIYMPLKCLRFDLKSYYLITFVSYECSTPEKLVKGLLHLAVVDKKYNIIDTKVVYIGTEYDWEMSGMLNPSNGVFIILSVQPNNRTKDAQIFKINSSLRFELIKEAKNVVGTTDDMEEAVTLLAWSDIFYN
jgi:hypothetical protein